MSRDRMLATALLAAPLLVVAAAAACGGDDGPEVIGTTVPDAEEITVVATDFAFDPDTIELTAGEPVNIVLEIEEGGHNLGVQGTDFLLPIIDGGSEVGTLQIDEPGEYRFLCTVPGHEAQGMTGVITVR